jgi:hypothetical protein
MFLKNKKARPMGHAFSWFQLLGPVACGALSAASTAANRPEIQPQNRSYREAGKLSANFCKNIFRPGAGVRGQ